MLHVWNIYLQNWAMFRVYVGKYALHGASGTVSTEGFFRLLQVAELAQELKVEEKPELTKARVGEIGRDGGARGWVNHQQELVRLTIAGWWFGT